MEYEQARDGGFQPLIFSSVVNQACLVEFSGI